MIYKKGQPTPNAKKISFSPLLTLLMQTKESINVSGSARMTTPAFPGLQLSSWKYILQKKVLILLWYLKVLCHEIYQSSESGKRNQIGWNIKITAQTPPGGGGGGGYMGKFLLGMCGNIQFTYFYVDSFLKCPWMSIKLVRVAVKLLTLWSLQYGKLEQRAYFCASCWAFTVFLLLSARLNIKIPWIVLLLH